MALAEALKGKLNIIGLDLDQAAISRARLSLEGKADTVILECADYRKLDSILDKHGIGKIDMMLIDAGISSDELETSGRGFSFQKDEPLLMTMGDPAGYAFTARDIVNGWKEDDIANVIFAYGEERHARRIAGAIAAYRQRKRVETSGELAELIKLSVPPAYRRGKIHPATRTFQALRIAVNDELGALAEGLAKGYARLASGGRMAVISFHSLEDRIVKSFFKEKMRTDGASVGKKPVKPSPEEIAANPRARSAKLRTLIKTQKP